MQKKNDQFIQKTMQLLNKNPSNKVINKNSSNNSIHSIKSKTPILK